jgi:DNA-binding GntR family transcriptional regulator
MMDTAEVRAVSSAADRVYAYAKDAVLSRRYAPHDLLTEGELATAVGVSRTPVREALLRLQADGLVRLLPKRGALVLPVTADEITDVLETRRLIESFAVRKAVGRAGTELIGSLTGYLEAMRRALRDRNAQAYVEADREFHAAIVAATDNQILIGVYRSLRERQLRMGVVNLLDDNAARVDPARMRAMIVEHEAIRDALAARTVRAAEAAVTAHLDSAERLLARTR